MLVEVLSMMSVVITIILLLVRCNVGGRSLHFLTMAQDTFIDNRGSNFISACEPLSEHSCTTATLRFRDCYIMSLQNARTSVGG
jgi:hypothetical protein